MMGCNLQQREKMCLEEQEMESSKKGIFYKKCTQALFGSLRLGSSQGHGHFYTFLRIT
jgi:hypothetical protein